MEGPRNSTHKAKVSGVFHANVAFRLPAFKSQISHLLPMGCWLFPPIERDNNKTYLKML